MMYYMNTNMTMYHGFAMLVFWLIIIFVLFSIFKSNNNVSELSAIDILKKRLAQGEIKKEEFEDLKQLI